MRGQPWAKGVNSRSVRRLPGAAVAIVAANLVPLAGVLYFGWDLFMVLLLFWFDNVVIGLFTVARIALSRVEGSNRSVSPERRRKNAAGYGFGFFFFTMIHGLFLILIFGHDRLNPLDLGIGVLALAASRGIDFHFDYARPKAYLTTDAMAEGDMP